MKLNELDNNPILNAQKALREQYEQPFKVDGMTMSSTRTMLQKVRGLISETKQAPDFYRKQTSPAYMKMVFMEQALVHHFNDLRNRPQPRIVFENEEVEKSQVVLAAQDLVDSVQKMLEQVGQMQVKELPALVSSIESEIGVNEAQQYDQEVTQALDGLSAALKEAFGGLKSALGTVTGQGGGDFGVGAPDEMGLDATAADAGMDAMAGAEDIPADVGAEPMPAEEPEPEPVAGAGRAKR
jgi:hypothetical protein